MWSLECVLVTSRRLNPWDLVFTPCDLIVIAPQNGFIRNSIFYNGDYEGIRTSGTSGTGTVENVTVYNMDGAGINASTGSTMTVKNAISVRDQL